MLDSAPPPARTRLSNHPTLLFSWWCTSFAATLIIMRVVGRKVRTNRLFSEDLIMAASMIPLFIRMGLIQVVLLDGTNNVQTAGLSPTDIRLRETGAKYVLAARIFYAAFIWMSKFTIYEFLKRTFHRTWEGIYDRILKAIRAFLVLTFIGVVIATLAECQPFDHYWQVVPDPGPQCRNGFAQLLTMGSTDIITDIILVAFPIPIILRSLVSPGRKTVLIMLFSFSLLLIGVTAARMVEVVREHGAQQYRTVWASIEILLSAFVSNGITLGSFARGKGMKRNKYRKESMTDSISHAPTRRGTIASSMSESVEDLFRSVGCRMPTELVEEAEDGPSQRPMMANKSDPEKGEGVRWENLNMPRPGRQTESTQHLAAFLRSGGPPNSHPDLDRGGPSDLRIADVGGLLGGSSKRVEKKSSQDDFRSRDFADKPRPHIIQFRSSFTNSRRSASRTPSQVPSRAQSPTRRDSDMTATPVSGPSAAQPSSSSGSDGSGVSGLDEPKKQPFTQL